MFRIPLVALTLLALAIPAEGQDLSLTHLEEGDRIRVTPSEGSIQEGQFLALIGDALIWQPHGLQDSGIRAQPDTLPMASLWFLERSRGVEGVGWRGFLGAVSVGAVVGGGRRCPTPGV